MKGESVTEKGAWQCKYCDKVFRYESDRRRHELSHVPQFECKRCCKKFSYLSALRRHEKTHERSSSVQCNQCGGHFRDELLLKRHVRYSHKGTYKCDKCTATFNSEPALGTHKKTHKPESERRFRCSFGCGKSFNFSHHLKHHEMTHTNTKQHFCKRCGKGFIQSHHLKTHEKTHEPKFWLPCTMSDCNKKFVNEYARTRHLATHRKTNNVGSSSDSSVTASKISPLEDSQDGELCPSRRKSNTSSGRNIIVKCKSTEEKGTFLFIDYESKDSQNNRLIDKHVIDERDNYFDDRENDFIDHDIKTCETAIGSCLVAGDPKIDQKCLCAQINNPNGETDEEFTLAPNNETLNVNAIEFSKRTHESERWLHDSIPDSNKKLIKSLAKHNGERRRSRKQPIAIHSSGRHIIVECKSTNEQRTVETKISKPLFIDYEYEDSQNNNIQENNAVYGREDNLDDPQNTSADSHVNTAAIGSYLATRDSDENEYCIKNSNPRQSEEFILESDNKVLAVNTVKHSSVEVSSVTSVVSLKQDFGITSYESVPSKCESCECANLCSISEKLACKGEAPNIKYIPGGIVKLKDILDFDFQASVKRKDRIKDVTGEINSEISDCNSSNLKSCKDVIGNCIVSGNSTMGEGCLCARMMVDDQAMAEEIDEITPCPQGMP